MEVPGPGSGVHLRRGHRGGGTGGAPTQEQLTEIRVRPPKKPPRRGGGAAPPSATGGRCCAHFLLELTDGNTAQKEVL